MTPLAPCPGCKRHVATHERVCPFCARALPVMRAQRVALIGRVSRAAVFSAALAACSKDKPKEAPPAPPAQGSDDLEKMLDNDGNIVEHAPAPPPIDAAVAEPDAAVVDAGVPPDAGVVKKKKKKIEPVPDPIPPHNIPKPYGAPPARKRIV